MYRNQLSKLYDRGAAGAVDPHVYRQLVGALFTPSLAIFTAAALCIGAVGALTTYRTGDVLIGLLSVAAVIIGLLRAILLVRFRRLGRLTDDKEAALWEARWAATSLSYAATVGLMAARGVAGTDDPIVHLLAAVSAVGTAGIVAVAAVRPNIVIGQLALLFAPLMVGVMLQENPYYWALAVTGVPFVLMISELTYSLYGTAVRALELATAQERLADELSAQNTRFDTALSNMAQGLCMFDENLRLTVCNKRFLELYGLSGDVVRPGITLKQLVDHSVSRTNDVRASAADLYALWSDQAAREEPTLSQRTFADGRTFAINYRPMPDGGHVATVEDVTEQRRAVEQVTHLAKHDVLTNLPNRLFFREQMQNEVGSLRRGHTVAVLCLDLDDFKMVNDTQGHPAGDALLVEVAIRLRGALDGAGFLARLGGDEFAALVKVADASEAIDVGKRIAEAIAQPFLIGGSQLGVGTSVGIAMAPLHGRDADTLLKRADIALYQAKADGRGSARLFEHQMAEALVERRALETELREAMAADQFELHYQPLVRLSDGQVSSLEALVRWRHPRFGLIGPDRFIPLAEGTGVIAPLGEWVMQRACNDAASWDKAIKVAVNLSPIQFRGDGLVAAVALALSRSGLDANRLELEITENVLLQDSEGNMDILRQIKELGVRIALDDFGTGYSSLSYLRQFPFDKVKIDKCFIEGESGHEGSAIIAAVTSLCRNLGISTTVEGVETENQLAQVRAEGCNEVQGHLFSYPQPLAKLREQFPALAASRLIIAA